MCVCVCVYLDFIDQTCIPATFKVFTFHFFTV